MDQPETTFVSVERARLLENRETTARKAVIRVQQGENTSYANDVTILGPSRLVYRPGAADVAGHPEVWLVDFGQPANRLGKRCLARVIRGDHTRERHPDHVGQLVQ